MKIFSAIWNNYALKDFKNYNLHAPNFDSFIYSFLLIKICSQNDPMMQLLTMIIYTQEPYGKRYTDGDTDSFQSFHLSPCFVSLAL